MMKYIYILLAVFSLILPFVVTEIGFPEFANANPQLFFATILVVSALLFVTSLVLAVRSFRK